MKRQTHHQTSTRFGLVIKLSDPNDKDIIKAVKQIRRFDDVKEVTQMLAMVTDGYKVTRVTSTHYQVAKPNQSPYNVHFDNKALKPRCDCPAWKECKHIKIMYFLGDLMPQLPTGHYGAI